MKHCFMGFLLVSKYNDWSTDLEENTLKT